MYLHIDEKWSIKENQIHIIKLLDTILGCVLNERFEAGSIINDSEHTMLMLVSKLICRFVEQFNNGGMLDEFDGHPYLLHHFLLFAHKHWNIPFANFFHCYLCFSLQNLVFIHRCWYMPCWISTLNNKSFWRAIGIFYGMPQSQFNVHQMQHRMYKN